MEEIHVIVRGRVQGVGFRAKVKKIADLLGLYGQVVNLSDGSVEMYVQGSSTKLDTFLLQVNQHFHAHIENIDLEKHVPTIFYAEFQIIES